jgi:hypothetical protein
MRLKLNCKRRYRVVISTLCRNPLDDEAASAQMGAALDGSTVDIISLSRERNMCVPATHFSFS